MTGHEAENNENVCVHTGRELTVKTLGSRRFGFDEKTGNVYYLDAKSLQYGSDYFLEEYSAQYGRTYFEDEPALREYAKQRLRMLSKYTLFHGKLFEIGCAAGFFLDEARKSGYQVAGLELAEIALKYAVEKLGLDISPEAFENYSIVKESYDVVAAFFVVEHLGDQRSAMTRISQMLRKGGYFIFSLPSAFGPAFQCNPDDWGESHPEDHFADYTPRGLKEIFPLYNMELVETRPFSYHPDRSCGLWKIAGKLGLYNYFARRFCYGDTLLGIAVKN